MYILRIKFRSSKFGKKTLALTFPLNVGITSLVHKSNAYFETHVWVLHILVVIVWN